MGYGDNVITTNTCDPSWRDGFNYITGSILNKPLNTTCHLSFDSPWNKICYEHPVVRWDGEKAKLISGNEVIKVEILQPGKVIRCTFADGKEEKAICDSLDVFDLETGIGICVAKHALGGSNAFNGYVRRAVSLYNRMLREEARKAKEEAEAKAIIQRREEKRRKRAEKRRRQKIADMTEAFSNALKAQKTE